MTVKFESGELVEHLPTGRTYRVEYQNATSGNVQAHRVAIAANGDWVWMDNTRAVTLKASTLQLWSAKTATRCERCGSEKPSGQSCGCFDNNCE